MRKFIYWTYIFCLSVFMSSGCGSSSPITPAQIPTEVSFASNDSYGDGVVIQMGKSITATADADFTDGEVVFTDTVSGETDTTGACGTASISGTEVSITGPSDWPNEISQCDITFSYDGTEVPATVGTVDGMVSAEFSKSFKAVSSNAMRTYIDTSSEVIAAKWSSAVYDQVVNNGITPEVKKISDQDKIYACYLGLSGSPLANTSVKVVTSSDDGQTYSTPVDLSDGDATVSNGCYMAVRKVGSNNTIAVALIGGEAGCSSGCSYRILLRISSDDGATFSTAQTVVPVMGSSPNMVLDENGVVHLAEYRSGAYYLYSCTASSCTEGYSFSVTSSNYMPRLAVDGSSVYMIYADTNGSGYDDIYIRRLTYSNGAYTAGDRFTLATETAASGDVNYEGIAVLRGGKLIVNWEYATSKEGYVSIVDPTTGAVSSEKLDDNVTAQSAVSVSASNNAHLFYYTTNGYYKLYEYNAATGSFTLGEAQPIDINELGTTGSAFTGSDGRFYYMYAKFDLISADPNVYNYGYLSLFKSVLE